MDNVGMNGKEGKKLPSGMLCLGVEKNCRYFIDNIP